MADFNAAEVLQAAQNAGFQGIDAATIVAIAQRESSMTLNPTPAFGAGEYHYGTFQESQSFLSTIHHPTTFSSIQDAMNVAFDHFKAVGFNFSPWTNYNPTTKQIYGVPTSPATVLTGSGQSILSQAGNGLSSFFSGLTGPIAQALIGVPGIGIAYAGAGAINNAAGNAISNKISDIVGQWAKDVQVLFKTYAPRGAAVIIGGAMLLIGVILVFHIPPPVPVPIPV